MNVFDEYREELDRKAIVGSVISALLSSLVTWIFNKITRRGKNHG